MAEIERYESTPRLSRAVIHADTVYLAGITSAARDADIAVQTRSVLETIDHRLASVGSSREKLLSAQIWLKDIDSHFAGMNAVWESWVPAGCTPARATCEAKLASPELLVEIIVIASR
jgi:enamine deaminase RidA (YjgF/YER057c/UK114 family)